MMTYKLESLKKAHQYLALRLQQELRQILRCVLIVTINRYMYEEQNRGRWTV